MINNRRGELEIITDILSLARGGVKKTEILYQVNLSYSQLKHYLSFLAEKKLIREEKNSQCRVFKTTDKGMELLENLNRVFSYLK